MVEESIFQLTALFRYTCSPQQETSLKEECRFLENYLLLQKIRFDERLNFSINLEKGLEDVRIPKLLLQPPVENAVVHALSPLDRPMTLLVYISSFQLEQKQFCRITIRDDGIGFDTASLENTQGIGLKNVKERLRIFSPASSFKVQSTKNCGTICTITFLIS